MRLLKENRTKDGEYSTAHKTSIQLAYVQLRFYSIVQYSQHKSCGCGQMTKFTSRRHSQPCGFAWIGLHSSTIGPSQTHSFQSFPQDKYHVTVMPLVRPTSYASVFLFPQALFCEVYNKCKMPNKQIKWIKIKSERFTFQGKLFGPQHLTGTGI